VACMNAPAKAHHISAARPLAWDRARFSQEAPIFHAEMTQPRQLHPDAGQRPNKFGVRSSYHDVWRNADGDITHKAGCWCPSLGGAVEHGLPFRSGKSSLANDGSAAWNPLGWYAHARE
jgi:hypothetical protein